jgi:hypothetical protein
VLEGAFSVTGNRIEIEGLRYAAVLKATLKIVFDPPAVAITLLYPITDVLPTN